MKSEIAAPFGLAMTTKLLNTKETLENQGSRYESYGKIIQAAQGVFGQGGGILRRRNYIARRQKSDAGIHGPSRRRGRASLYRRGAYSACAPVPLPRGKNNV